MRSSFLAVQLEPAASGVTRYILKLAAMLGMLAASGCIPYTVGSTAEIVPVGRMRTATSYYFIPNGVTSPDDSTGSPLAGIDLEWRYGLDLRSGSIIAVPAITVQRGNGGGRRLPVFGARTRAESPRR